jgi:2-dehydropantoate 2-reductase
LPMKILVYGAGVIGTLYGGRLARAGHRVTVVARGRRLVEIRQHGLVLEDIVHRRRWRVRVEAAERFDPENDQDLALITVRRDQLTSVLPELATNSRIPILLFMLNNPTGSASLAEALGPDRVLLGFPGAGGTRDGHVVSYAMIAQQPTTLGELDGTRTGRLREIAKAFRDADFPTKICGDMDAWLKAHAFFVTAICGAIYLAAGDCRNLSRDNAVLTLMMHGVREGFTAVRALGQIVTPFSLQVLFTWLPDVFVIGYWRRFFATEMADYIFGGHARAAAREMRDLASDCRSLLEKSGVEAPSLWRLYRAIDEFIGEPVGD